MGKKNKTLSHW